MKTEAEIRAAIQEIEELDGRCRVTAHQEGRLCLDVGHAILGTYTAVLLWVLGEREPLWQREERR